MRLTMGLVTLTTCAALCFGSRTVSPAEKEGVSSLHSAKISVLATDGHLPFPYGRELTGYEVRNLPDTSAKASAAGATVLAGPYTTGVRQAAVVRFPGGYIVEIHSVTDNR